MTEHGNENFVVVEVQRRRGDTLSFHRDCRKILDAAAGDTTNICSTRFHPPRIPQSIECKPMNSAEMNKLAIDSLRDIALVLKEGSMLDQMVLGMERLCFLTNPLSSGDMARITFSNMPQEILQKIRDTIMLFRKQSEKSDDFSIDDWDIPDVDEYYNTILHNQAMKVMSNLILLSNEASFSRYPCNDLVPSLLNIMKDAACQPQEAYHACRCLGAILQMKYSTRDELLRNDALDIFEKTQLVGKCSHLLLEEESGRIINSLIC
eukprot:CAMPEP_0194404646 /NCGR_PEP_ID=MMETSP0176-20130528/3141_1 /TAXON_ID=216777 /ORGANISM="Proboscia alata, Strain PI-D3" /LENGTH=263 /DNA_ID=CAMNT_0039203067 /DNA_START=477 /DNA_END=1268 /DNA_ORIENTATION=+